MEYLGLAARLVVGLVFVVAAAPKLRDHAAFRSSVAAYKILPDSLVTPVARALPPAELVLGLMLLAGVLVVPAAWLAAALLVGFGAAIWIAVERGSRIGCGCGFRHLQQVSRVLVARNAALAVAAVLAAVAPSAALSLAPGPGVPETTIDTTDGWAVAMAVLGSWVLVQVLLELRRFVASSPAASARA
jgi:uncharacterized membrane protein YphA (DoxX/SURF4 family)